MSASLVGSEMCIRDRYALARSNSASPTTLSSTSGRQTTNTRAPPLQNTHVGRLTALGALRART
eukprot:2202176-Alexandrium_andersonii.AAC.1